MGRVFLHLLDPFVRHDTPLPYPGRQSDQVKPSQSLTQTILEQQNYSPMSIVYLQAVVRSNWKSDWVKADFIWGPRPAISCDNLYCNSAVSITSPPSFSV